MASPTAIAMGVKPVSGIAKYLQMAVQVRSAAQLLGEPGLERLVSGAADSIAKRMQSVDGAELQKPEGVLFENAISLVPVASGYVDIGAEVLDELVQSQLLPVESISAVQQNPKLLLELLPWLTKSFPKV